MKNCNRGTALEQSEGKLLGHLNQFYFWNIKTIKTERRRKAPGDAIEKKMSTMLSLQKKKGTESIITYCAMGAGSRVCVSVGGKGGGEWWCLSQFYSRESGQ